MKKSICHLKIRDNVANTLEQEKPESKESTYTNNTPKVWWRDGA